MIVLILRGDGFIYVYRDGSFVGKYVTKAEAEAALMPF